MWIKPDALIKKIVSKTFPSYRGRKFKVSTNIPKKLDSYWSGGSRDYYCFYELNSEKCFDVISNHPAFESSNPRDLDVLPRGIIIVKHSISCGKDCGITIYANKDDVVPLLPEKTGLTENERIVLTYTRSYKSSYNGIKNYRWCEANREKGISLEDWEEAKKKLIDKGLLNKRGAITISGKNAL